MRLAVLSPYTDPIRGGITSYTRELAAAYRSLGLEVAGFAAFGQTNTEFRAINSSKMEFMLRVVLACLDWKPNIVHAHSHWFLLLPAVIVKLLRPKTRLLFTFHTPPGVGSRGMKNRLFRGLLCFCNGVTFVSQAMMNDIGLSASISQAVVHAAPERTALRADAKPRRTGASRTILFAGPLVWPLKVDGVSLLLRSFAEVSESFPVWEVVIIGDGPLKKRLEQESMDLGIRDKVRFEGFVEDIVSRIANADLYAQISLQEGLPLSLLDAMALGVPVLATEIGGMPEVVTNGSTGRLVPPTMKALSAALSDVMANESLRNKLGEMGRSWVLSNLTWMKVADLNLQLIGEERL